MKNQQAYQKSSFGPAFFFLKRRERRALANYYAFCRLADDIADEPQPNPKQALKQLAHEVAYVYLGAPQTALGKALLEDVRHFHLPRDRFTLLLEAMQADLEGKQYTPSNPENPFEALDWYIYRVSVIVGKTTLDILGQHGPQADALAHALGTAVQLTNIVRDVYEDARLGRVYIPCKLTAREILDVRQKGLLPDAQLEQASLQGDLNSARGILLKKALQLCINRAEENYQVAFQLMDEFWPVTILPCRIIGYVYQKNLAKIKATALSFTQPVKLTKWEKVQAVNYALFKTLF